MVPNDYSKTLIEVDSWFGLQSSTFMLTVLVTYFLLIFQIVPKYMKNKAAYQLKTFITVYNILQVLACSYVVNEILVTTSGKIWQFWKCTYFESNTKDEHTFNRISYFIFWLKIVELTETVVFVLRKKQNQVSFLHVFHHCNMVTLAYMFPKFHKGGSAMYPYLLNSVVHIIMYSYYLAAAVCDKPVVNRLRPIKQSITIIQMVQFVLVLLQAAVVTSMCNLSSYLISYFSIVVIVIFYGFYDFYKKAYK